MKSRKAKMLAEIVPQVLKNRCFEQRSNLGTMVQSWNEIFEGEFGELIERDGDVLRIRVQGAPLRSELESFKKWEILEILQMHEEFSGIRDLKFTE
jgi:hypothetical protein